MSMETLSEKYGHLFQPVAPTVTQPAAAFQHMPPVQLAPQAVAPSAAAPPPAAPSAPVVAPQPQPQMVAPQQPAPVPVEKPSTMRMILIAVGVSLFVYVCYRYFYGNTDEEDQSKEDSAVIEKLRASAERSNAMPTTKPAAAPMRAAVRSPMPPVQPVEAQPQRDKKPSVEKSQPPKVDPKFETV